MRPLAVGGPEQLKAPPLAAESMRTHLENILASPSFSGAWRQQRLLRFLVEAAIQGRTAELKEYSLGVEVFDKGEGFDPRLDPIVRVEVSRLRTRLKRYYEAEGKDDPIRIVLPRGSYVPLLLEPSEAKAVGNGQLPGDGTAAESSKPVARSRRWVSTGLGLAILATVTWLVADRALGPGPAEPAADAYEFSRLTREQARCNSPSLSPEGRFLVYSRRDQDHWDIFLRRLDSEESVNLTAGSAADDRQPAFSPDGRRIAFRSERDGGGIFVMDLAGNSVRRVADFGYHPSWAPDGKRLVFSSDTFAEPEDGPARRASVLFVANLDSGTVRALTSADVVWDAVQPAWSPHGDRIAFWGSGPDGKRDLWTVPASNAPPGEPPCDSCHQRRVDRLEPCVVPGRPLSVLFQ